MLRGALLVLLPSVASAQRPQIEVHVGRSAGDNHATTYEFRASTPAGRVFTHGFSAIAMVNDSLGRRRAFYGGGYEVQALRGRRTLGAYGIAGLALGLSTDTSTQELAVLWSAGVGLEWRPLSAFAIGVEGRYRVDDRGPRGFWRTGPDARAGFGAAVGVSLGIGRRGAGGGSGYTSPEAYSSPRAPVPPPMIVTGNASGVVETALSVLGTPYQWGGTAANGFDCSGLIQYAYGQHGIRLPRRGRDQALAGAEVTPVVEALRPGDILLFSSRPGAGVTHVGLYVGEGKFIHSSNEGVKISPLDPHDPEGGYWLVRWVGARRIMP